MPAEPSREAKNALLRAARAFAEMHAALDKAQAALDSADTFWLAQYGSQAYAHHVQGRAYVSTARDHGVPDALVRHAAAGDVQAVQDALRG